MSEEVKIVLCEYKDGEKTFFFENVFEMTERQKSDLKTSISQMTKVQHKENPYKMKISEQQRNEILAFHKELISALKEAYSVDSDEDLAEILQANELIVFTDHAQQRLTERFTGSGVNNESHFAGLYELLGLGPQSKAELAQEATEIFVKANKIHFKVEWADSNFCRINYSLDGDKTVLCVENRLLSFENIDTYYLVVTVMKNDPQ